MTLPFIGESSTVLKAYASAFRSGQLTLPLSKMSLSRIAQCSEGLSIELMRLSSEGMAASHMALVLDLAAEAADMHMNGVMSADLVWTGPEASVAHSRDTAVVVESCSRTLNDRFWSAASWCNRDPSRSSRWRSGWNKFRTSECECFCTSLADGRTRGTSLSC